MVNNLSKCLSEHIMAVLNRLIIEFKLRYYNMETSTHVHAPLCNVSTHKEQPVSYPYSVKELTWIS